MRARAGTPPKHRLDALEDCPRPSRSLSSAEDIENIERFLLEEDRARLIEQERCLPAQHACLRACQVYTGRCPGPYRALDTCIVIEMATGTQFCSDACDGSAPFLSRARYFQGRACEPLVDDGM